jgi:hypothetical protein
MGHPYFRKVIFFSTLCVFLQKGVSQPFVDIINTSYQSLSTVYKDSSKTRNTTNNYFLNLTVPIKIDSQNTLIVRFYGENLYSAAKISDASFSFNLSSALLPIGLQHETKSKKWKYMGLVMPKLSGHLREETTGKDFQLGGYGLVTYKRSDKLSFKLGLFYNKEFFGNFFMPLAGVDWRINERLQLYGVLPTNYRLEYAIARQKLYTGFAFQSYTRSYHIDLKNGLKDSSNVYVKNVEIKAKLFIDYYVTKRFVLFVDFGRTINYSPKLYWSGTRDEVKGFTLYSPIKDAFFFNAGLAYRIRFDFI